MTDACFADSRLPEASLCGLLYKDLAGLIAAAVSIVGSEEQGDFSGVPLGYRATNSNGMRRPVFLKDPNDPHSGQLRI
jgi:hypothetical protein